jgi:hypothetical protein
MLVRLALLAAAALLCFSPIAYAQSSITRFEDVVGKWTDAPLRTTTGRLEIDAAGRFNARSLLGGESGTARLDNGVLVIPLVEHKGTLQLVLRGDTLKGRAPSPAEAALSPRARRPYG